ncbi:MAG: hypothetical protein AABY53_08685 [Bdellovibrionota bacterium]
MKVVIIGLCLFLTQAVFASRINVSDFDKNENEIIINLKGIKCDGKMVVSEPNIECINKMVDLNISAECSDGDSPTTGIVKFPMANPELLAAMQKCKAKKILININSEAPVLCPLSIEEVEKALAN